MSDKKVIIYTQQTCPPCHQAKAWMTDHDIPFDNRDIRENPQYMQEIIDLGAAATPVLVVGEQVLMGFQPEKVKAAWEALQSAE